VELIPRHSPKEKAARRLGQNKDSGGIATGSIWLMLVGISFIGLSMGPRALGSPVHVLHPEGVVHGFLALRTPAGKIIANGDLIQTTRGSQMTARLEFHFSDGSLHGETAVFTQRGSFRLQSYHMIEKGPAFEHPVEMWIDVSKNQVRVLDLSDGKNKLSTDHVDLPDDLANGLVPILVKNMRSGAAEITVSLVAATPKPRVVKLIITPQGDDSFSIAGSQRKAKTFVAKVKIGGVAGAVASLAGKQPPDTHFWISTGESPVFLKSEGPIAANTPVWQIELASPVWPEASASQR
jgi:hypothetical protein